MQAMSTRASSTTKEPLSTEQLAFRNMWLDELEFRTFLKCEAHAAPCCVVSTTRSTRRSSCRRCMLLSRLRSRLC